MVLNYFTPNINARYFRIHVLSYEIHPRLRMELAKCGKYFLLSIEWRDFPAACIPISDTEQCNVNVFAM
jgi:hypothetical protein